MRAIGAGALLIAMATSSCVTPVSCPATRVLTDVLQTVTCSCEIPQWNFSSAELNAAGKFHLDIRNGEIHEVAKFFAGLLKHEITVSSEVCGEVSIAADDDVTVAEASRILNWTLQYGAGPYLLGYYFGPGAWVPDNFEIGRREFVFQMSGDQSASTKGWPRPASPAGTCREPLDGTVRTKLYRVSPAIIEDMRIADRLAKETGFVAGVYDIDSQGYLLTSFSFGTRLFENSLREAKRRKQTGTP